MGALRRLAEGDQGLGCCSVNGAAEWCYLVAPHGVYERRTALMQIAQTLSHRPAATRLLKTSSPLPPPVKPTTPSIRLN